MQFSQRRYRDPRHPQFHPGTSRGVEHPCRDDQDVAGSHFDMHNFTDRAPLGRHGQPDEIAPLCVYLAGDESAFMALVDRHGPLMLRIARSHVPSRAIAEEVVQEAWLGVLQGLGRFEGRSSVSTWIMSIARFKALSARRRRQDVGLDETLTETIADQSPTPEQAILETDRGAQVRACLTQLSPDHREIVDLVYYHDKTIDEISEIIGVPKNTVKTRMFYARKRLAQLLARRHDFHHLATAAV